MASTIKVSRGYLFLVGIFFAPPCSLVSFINLDKLELGNTPTATIEDNKISFVLPSKFPFSYSNHPQGLKTSNSEKKLGFLNSTVQWCGLHRRSPFVRASEISCRYPSDNLDVFVDCHEGRGCALERKNGFLRALNFWIL